MWSKGQDRPNIFGSVWHFLNESIVFKHGTAGIFGIKYKRVGVSDELEKCGPVSSIFHLCQVNSLLDHWMWPFFNLPTFSDNQFTTYAFRNRISQIFATAIQAAGIWSLYFEALFESSDSHAEKITTLGEQLCGGVAFVDTK